MLSITDADSDPILTAAERNNLKRRSTHPATAQRTCYCVGFFDLRHDRLQPEEPLKHGPVEETERDLRHHRSKSILYVAAPVLPPSLLPSELRVGILGETG